MCGILGYSGSFDPAALSAGLTAIAHRGPDDAGVFVDEAYGVGLANVRLAIQDLSPLGHQPMFGANRDVVLVLNGEIYNFRELRVALEAKGEQFIGHSDTEVLLRLYLTEGEAMLPRLNGIFAFAIWDRRTRSTFIARDGLGVKPLYVASTSHGIAFGSEIKGLVPLIPEVRELDPMALHRYLSFLWCPGDGTPFKAVKKLGPGEALVLRDGRIERQWKWYTLPAHRGVVPDLDEQASVSGTVTHLREAVHRQMVSDVPVGAFLSGGLDSSAVVAFAREVHSDIHCFTIDEAGGKDDGETNDLPYAQRVAKHLGVSLEVVAIDANRMAGDLAHMVAQLDEPLADPAPLNVLYISQLARQQGIKVLLSGVGGDDLFAGYRRHRAVQAETYWAWLPQTVRRSLTQLSAQFDQRRPFTRRLRKLFAGAALEGDARLVEYFRWGTNQDLMALYTPDFARAIVDAPRVTPMLDFLSEIPKGVSPVERLLALEQRYFLADHNLTYTDKMSMAAGVEARVPFLDPDLVEFAARVPSDLKLRHGMGKWVLKRAMEPYLPHDVIYRAKTGFGAPLRRWMRRDLRELLGDLLSTSSLNARGMFDPAAVHRLIEANDAGRVDASYTLLSLLCVEIWCRSFLDGRPGAVTQ